MKILIFQDNYRPKLDGVIISTELFMKGLKARGHDVKLVVPRFPGDESDYPEDVILVPAVSTDWIYPGSCLGKFWAAKLEDHLGDWKPDIVHSMTEFTLGHWLSSYWRSRFDVPRIHTFHTLWSEYLFYIPLVPVKLSMIWLRYTAPRAVRKRCDRLIAPSDAMANAIRKDWNVGDFPISVVPTGIEVDRFEQKNGAAFRAANGIQDDEKVVLYLGRLGDEKNVELVVQTMAELRRREMKKLRFVIAGGGPDGYVKKLHKMAEKLGLEDIVWTGFITGQDWLDCYGGADLFLFPSITETQGLVVMESLAAGVPMVSVPAMGPASSMKGERGCLFAENDPKDFADKAQRMLEDDALRAEKREQGLALAQEYSVQARSAQLEGVYEEVIAEYRAQKEGA